MPGQRPPTVRLRRLAAELRRLRADADLTREDVTRETGINPATLYRIETARGKPQQRTLMALLKLYEVSQSQLAELVALSQGADAQGWLRPYHSELPEEYTAYISFEAEARSVRNYESLFIPGLLQTEDYARAVIRSGLPMADSRVVEQRVQARLERQAALTGERPLHLWAITDEAAIRRIVGGPEVMSAQLRYLVSAGEAPNVTIQVIPFAAGAHAGMPGSFVLMSFPDSEDPEIIYIDSMAGDLFLEAEVDVRRYELLFDNLRAVALGPDDSTNLIKKVAEELQAGEEVTE
ncbi:helix-turn-helix domain-containing protein [Kitasatospora viridis]|uniref:Helix-turn-helix protein n=1 Tax=Kitasatospora viridis TaxID=281105 RepID=A0A561TT47_9ACTN|nr:helix-turn-helix transcriptional regulator [Kitasatospora viridis]TWF90271.1 helix-turn-helix protein [Kitasatospora viridis]